jgi:hypothetical protein
MLFNMPFGAIQLVATLGGAWLATRYKTKGGVVALLCLPAIAGCVMLLELPRGDAHKGPLLAGYYIVSSSSFRVCNPVNGFRSLSIQESVRFRSHSGGNLY